MVMERKAPSMLPVLVDVPYQFWALLGATFAAFLASRLKPASPQDPADAPPSA